MQEVVEAASNDGVFGSGPRRRNFEGGANAAFSLGSAEPIAGLERLRPGKSCASEPARNCVGGGARHGAKGGGCAEIHGGMRFPAKTGERM